MQAVRLKRKAGARDALPDEAFLRLRGALFFGPGFLVTRNKLTFRDNLAELLAAAVPGLLHLTAPGKLQHDSLVRGASCMTTLLQLPAAVGSQLPCRHAPQAQAHTQRASSVCLDTWLVLRAVCTAAAVHT